MHPDKSKEIFPEKSIYCKLDFGQNLSRNPFSSEYCDTQLAQRSHNLKPVQKHTILFVSPKNMLGLNQFL